jgi:uncharacterized protein YkwD
VNGQNIMRTFYLRAVLASAVVCLVLLSSAWAQPASGAERVLLDSVNHERRAQGLPALRWNEALADAAQRHAQEMARQDSVSHTLPGEPSLASRATKAGARFSWISENIVQSASAAGAHEQFMKSSNHRANILDVDMDSVGIGVAERHGQLFVVEDFAKIK